MTFPLKKLKSYLSCSNPLNSASCMDVKSILHKKFFYVYTDDDKPEMTMPLQIDVK